MAVKKKGATHTFTYTNMLFIQKEKKKCFLRPSRGETFNVTRTKDNKQTERKKKKWSDVQASSEGHILLSYAL